MHCFSMPEHLEECLERGYAISFAGNVTYRSAAELADAAARVPEERLLVETDAPYLTPQVGPQAAQPARLRGPHGRLPGRSCAGSSPSRALGRHRERNAARIFGWA